jgi:hypothetical protein
MDIQNLVGKVVEVIVSKNGKLGSKELKVCKANTRSILFIEVDRVNRVNTFRKTSVKNIDKFGEMGFGKLFVQLKDGVLLNQNKWESHWDSIGSHSPMVQKHFSNHSKGWSSNAPQYRSTTNNPVSGFPMV